MVMQAFSNDEVDSHGMAVTMWALTSIQAAAAQALHDYCRAAGSHERHLVGLQASIDQLDAVLRRWESEAARMIVGLPSAAAQPHLSCPENERTSR